MSSLLVNVIFIMFQNQQYHKIIKRLLSTISKEGESESEVYMNDFIYTSHEYDIINMRAFFIFLKTE